MKSFLCIILSYFKLGTKGTKGFGRGVRKENKQEVVAWASWAAVRRSLSFCVSVSVKAENRLRLMMQKIEHHQRKWKWN